MEAPTRLLVVTAAALGVQVAASRGLLAVLRSLTGTVPLEVLQWVALAGGVAVNVAVFAGVPWYVYRDAGGVLARLRLDRGDWWRVLVGWLAALGATAATIAAHAALTGTEAAGNVVDTGTAIDVGFAVVAVAVAPFVEELFFRGLLLDAVRTRFGTVAAVVGSSVVFGVMHVRAFDANGAMVGVATGVTGLVAAVLTVRTVRLGPAVAMHLLVNLAAVAAVL